MTINEMTICNLIQSFPVLLILAQNHRRCLETHFVYKPPSPTQSPEYYLALEALFQNLYGHGSHGYPAHDTHKPCYTYSKKYGIKPCHSGHGYQDHGYGSYSNNYGPHYSTSYGSHGTDYGSHSYGSPGYGSPGYGSPGYGSPGYGLPGYGSLGYSSPGYGYGYGTLGSPGYKKGDIYAGNVTYGGGYASTQAYSSTNNRYKVVVKKTRIGRPKKKSGKLVAGSNDGCTTVNLARGQCISIQDCRPFLQVIRSHGSASNPIVTWMLRMAHCGFHGNTPKVCCPIDEQKDEQDNIIADSINPVTSSPFIETRTTVQSTTTTQILPRTTSTLPPTTTSTLPPTTSTLPPTTTSTLPTTTSSTLTSTLPSIITTQPTTTNPFLPTSTKAVKKEPLRINYDTLSIFGDTCRTVYNNTGSCSDVYLCQPLMALAKRASRDPAAASLLKNSHCGFKRNIPQVCCPLPGQGDPPTSTELPTTGLRQGGEFLAELPEPPVCGVSNVSLDRVVAGIPAKLGAFPWMSLLGYRDGTAAGVRWRCGGALVSARHVLTAAHCIHRQEDDLFLVRLGELDLDREDEGAAPLDVPIQEMIKHQLYTKTKSFSHDIGLLVLEREVAFTDLIRPICLPSKKWLSNSFEDFNPFVAGWGNLKFKGVAASHLQVAQIPVLGEATCARAYAAHLAGAGAAPGHFPAQSLCAGYLQGGADTCSGDSGGPLMQPLPSKDYRTYFYAIGVVSVGIRCGQEGFPGVYARVTHYMPWIQEKLLG